MSSFVWMIVIVFVKRVTGQFIGLVSIGVTTQRKASNELALSKGNIFWIQFRMAFSEVEKTIEVKYDS